MTPESVARILKPHAHDLRDRFGVDTIVLFGSVARGEATEDSDVDLMVRFARPPTYEVFLDLADGLEAALGRPVDLVTASAVRARLRSRIAKEGVRVA
ncbi:MAG: nucleotidyltransferase family protein [Fimbriimonadaceae bacterium]|nr:nucleotidyltransferase family protein [Fimbriimonadaceae bacterium]